MKRPYCRIDGIAYQLEYRDCLRFPNDNRPEIDLNIYWVGYIKGELPLHVLFTYYINSGSSYELVWSNFSNNGYNNHSVKQGKEKTKSFRLYK